MADLAARRRHRTLRRTRRRVTQDPAAQVDALSAAGMDPLYVDHASGVLTERPELAKLLAQIRPGDTLVVWRLDRLGAGQPRI
jgi:DNA invertase Pin-like site-specific DNA recombinase